MCLKSTNTQKNNLPFDNNGHHASCLNIKKVGVVSESMNDKGVIKIDWNPDIQKTTIYHFYYGSTIQEIVPNSERAKRLIGYIFEGKKQENPIQDSTQKEDSIAPKNMKIIIANITWDENGWKDIFYPEKSGHGHVKNGGLPHECFNFKFDAKWNTKENIYGYFQRRGGIGGDNNLIFFHSNGKIVGVYGNSQFGNFKREGVPNSFEGFNIKADKNMSFRCNKYIDLNKETHFFKYGNGGKHEKMGQSNFNYINEKSAINILNDIYKEDDNKEYASIIEKLKIQASMNFTIFEKIKSKLLEKKFDVRELYTYRLRIGVRNFPKNIGIVIRYDDREEKIKIYIDSYNSIDINKKESQKYLFENNKALIAEKNVDIFKYVSLKNDGNKGYKVLLNKKKYVPSEEAIEKILKDVLFIKNNYNFDDLLELPHVGEEKLKNIFNKNMKKQPLNQILYGPPGTGKTYNTINKTIEILEPEFYLKNKNDRKLLHKKFEELKNSKQIEFVTFHQSYGYEDFVEGIKADTENENISYSLESGIFKKICERAELNFKKNTKISFVDLNNLFFNFIKQSWAKKNIFLKKQGGSFFIEKIHNEHIIINAEGISNEIKLKSEMFLQILKDFYSKGQECSVKNIREKYWSQRKATQDPSYYYPIYSAFIEHVNIDTAISSELKETKKNYIIIIDEINRGNISKIFGELITLIEDSKRQGNNEHLEITLPNSQETFSVPNNLYILGTMNTADRSIALLDTALRRRFEFIEMSPNAELLSEYNFEINNNTIDLKNLLETINKRIEYLYDRDHCIGHAYFMSLQNFESNDEKLTELQNIFATKIIPLLQEYFYDDWEKINLILGNNNFITEKNELSAEKLFGNNIAENIDIDDEKKFYSVTSSQDWKIEDFQSIYTAEKSKTNHVEQSDEQ